MDIQSEKIELAKRLLDTDSESIINAVKTLLNSLEPYQPWGDLPESVVADVEESLKQIEAGEYISHDAARETYKKWL